MNTDSVLGYSRPAMLGGPVNSDREALTIRWYGTSNYELNFRAVLIGHPHYDHTSDAARVAEQTGARVVVHSLGADVLTRGGLDVNRIVDVEPVTVSMKSGVIAVGDQ